MKQIIEKIIKVVEDSQGNQEVIENEITAYINSNKDMIDSESNKLSEKLEQAMKEIKDQQDFNAVMQAMFKVMTEEIGEENFKKIMELQEKYPFLKDMTSKIMPD